MERFLCQDRTIAKAAPNAIPEVVAPAFVLLTFWIQRIRQARPKAYSGSRLAFVVAFGHADCDLGGQYEKYEKGRVLQGSGHGLLCLHLFSANRHMGRCFSK